MKGKNNEVTSERRSLSLPTKELTEDGSHFEKQTIRGN